MASIFKLGRDKKKKHAPWYIMFFDMSTAFLSGKEIGRAVYVRGPADGLPSVNGHPA